MKNKCIIVGANGFLGSALSKKLLDLQFVVYAVYNKSFINIPPRSIACKIDEIFNIVEDVDYIFFTAGSYKDNLEKSIQTNIILLNSLIDKFYNAKIIYISSVNVYGNHDEIINENSSFNNPNLYGQSKICGEFLIKKCLKYGIIRFTYLYGPSLDNNSFLPTIINQLKKTNTIKLFGDGSRSQDYLYIDDAVDLCIKAMKFENNDIFLGATGISVTNNEIANILINNFENSKIIYTETSNEISSFYDPTITKVKLNWDYKVTLVDGIKKMLL